MLRKYNLPQKNSFLFLIFFGIFFFYLYFFSPVLTFPKWDFYLILLGFLIPVLFFASVFLPPLMVVILLGLLINKSCSGFILSPNMSEIDFLLQFGFFYWGLEAGSRICLERKNCKLAISPLFIALAFSGILFLFTGDWESSILLAVLFSGISTFFRGKEDLTFNLIPYFLTLAVFSFFFKYQIGLSFLLFFVAFFIFFSIYEVFLRTRIPIKLIVFFTGVCIVLISSFAYSLPVFITGIVTGIFFYRNRVFQTNFFTDFYKLILLTLMISQVRWNLNDLLMSLSIVGIILILYFLINKNRLSGLEYLPLELPLAFFLILPSYLGNTVLVFTICVLFLTSLSKFRKASGHLFLQE